IVQGDLQRRQQCLNAACQRGIAGSRIFDLIEFRGKSAEVVDCPRRSRNRDTRPGNEPVSGDRQNRFGPGRFMRRALGENIELHMDLNPSPCTSAVDAAQLQAAMLNITLNARDAMPQGGRLSIETRCEEHGPADSLNGDEWKPGRYVAIRVRDTGVGMAPDVRARAFEPFFTTKDVGQGSGLGLSQVHGFVHQAGGHVLLDSAEGRGTTVAIYLPEAEEKPAT